MPAVTPLSAAQRLTVRAAADAFLDTLPNLNTVRAYATNARQDRAPARRAPSART
ncbi:MULTISPECIES: hypothetical protein [unclassified Nonomuraea]|uniref:hypothetical protein n=1 Tax=unclassified Nonomuraea TaxID=2593643 RepID=UPI0033DC8305